jgi:PH (Pleckstrin Homology) domain-containing protein
MTAKDDLQGAAGVSLGQIIEDEDERDGQADDTETPRVDVRNLITGGERTPRGPGDDGWDFEIPREVARYLKPDETRAIPLRQHVARLLLPGVAFVGGLLAAIALNSWVYETGHADPAGVHAIWLLWVAAAGWSLWRHMMWRQTWFVVTGHRVILIETSARLSRRITMLAVDKVRDMEYDQTLIGRAFGYATFRFSSIGTERALQEVRFLPFPEWLYQEISELTMPADERKSIKRNRA